MNLAPLSSHICDGGSRDAPLQQSRHTGKPPPKFKLAIISSKRGCVIYERVAEGPPSDRPRRPQAASPRAGQLASRECDALRIHEMTNETRLIPETVTDTVVVAGRMGGRRPTLHIPDGTGRPYCGIGLTARRSTGGTAGALETPEDRWREKSIEVYPEGWREWCGRCCRKVVRDGRPAQLQPLAADGGEPL